MGFGEVVDDFRFHRSDLGRAEISVPDYPETVVGVGGGGRWRGAGSKNLGEVSISVEKEICGSRP